MFLMMQQHCNALRIFCLVKYAMYVTLTAKSSKINKNISFYYKRFWPVELLAGEKSVKSEKTIHNFVKMCCLSTNIMSLVFPSQQNFKITAVQKCVFIEHGAIFVQLLIKLHSPKHDFDHFAGWVYILPRTID